MADSISKLAEPAYLGDGLYVSHDGWQVELFAHNGIFKTNQVFLEPEVLVAFEAYLKDFREKS